MPWEVTASCRVSQAGPIQPLVWTTHLASRRDGQPRHPSRAPLPTAVPPSCPVFHQGSLKVKTTGRKVKPPEGEGKAK